jgi:hypothetical protein
MFCAGPSKGVVTSENVTLRNSIGRSGDRHHDGFLRPTREEERRPGERDLLGGEVIQSLSFESVLEKSPSPCEVNCSAVQPEPVTHYWF